MSSDEHLDEKQKLAQENFVLKSKLIAKGSTLSESPEVSPEIENQFLQNVIDFENAPTKPMYEIMGIDPANFPPAEQLNQFDLQLKFIELVNILEEHNFIYELGKDLPISIAYKYLVEKFLSDEGQVMQKGWRYHINGCDGYCPDCFQLDYCKIWDEIWTKEEIEEERKKIQTDDGKN